MKTSKQFRRKVAELFGIADEIARNKTESGTRFYDVVPGGLEYEILCGFEGQSTEDLVVTWAEIEKVQA